VPELHGHWVGDHHDCAGTCAQPYPKDAGLLVIVPSRGRPESVARVVQAWWETEAYEAASLVFAIDEDDPRCREYYSIDYCVSRPGITQVSFVALPKWLPMVAKLNQCATAAAGAEPPWGGIAFMGDDHLPRTKHWAGMLLAELDQTRTGIVYGRDCIQNQRLPTWWAMTPDIIRTLGRMVPADVEHLYCDNAIKDLGEAADCLRYLPDVLIEHMHPVAGKAPMDAGYARVNRQEQYRRDRLAYEQWRDRELPDQAVKVRATRVVNFRG
jgi:hypothetical protein